MKDRVQVAHPSLADTGFAVGLQLVMYIKFMQHQRRMFLIHLRDHLNEELGDGG